MLLALFTEQSTHFQRVHISNEIAVLPGVLSIKVFNWTRSAFQSILSSELISE